jgi:hypothetical protein
VSLAYAHTEERMPNDQEQTKIRITLTSDQKEQVKAAAGRDAEAIELTVQELEQRIAPAIASNHNETMLVE